MSKIKIQKEGENQILEYMRWTSGVNLFDVRTCGAGSRIIWGGKGWSVQLCLREGCSEDAGAFSCPVTHHLWSP